jgi:hypothetical protein
VLDTAPIVVVMDSPGKTTRPDKYSWAEVGRAPSLGLSWADGAPEWRPWPRSAGTVAGCVRRAVQPPPPRASRRPYIPPPPQLPLADVFKLDVSGMRTMDDYLSILSRKGRWNFKDRQRK